MKHGERQMSSRMEGIRQDHRARYIFASSYIKQDDKVLDAICGIGYGSKLMSELSSSFITAFDNNEEAILMAQRFYKSSNISFLCMDFHDMPFPKESFDIITCFEAIEHVVDDELLLDKLYDCLKPSGRLIISTPNETVMPYNKEKFPEHIAHYKPLEFCDLLDEYGFIVESLHNQKDKHSFHIDDGTDGSFMIAVCRKK